MPPAQRTWTRKVFNLLIPNESWILTGQRIVEAVDNVQLWGLHESFNEKKKKKKKYFKNWYDLTLVYVNVH